MFVLYLFIMHCSYLLPRIPDAYTHIPPSLAVHLMNKPQIILPSTTARPETTTSNYNNVLTTTNEEITTDNTTINTVGSTINTNNSSVVSDSSYDIVEIVHSLAGAFGCIAGLVVVVFMARCILKSIKRKLSTELTDIYKY